MSVIESFKLPTLTNVQFDKEDAELFRLDDKDLKAQAIFNSILPRLQCVANDAIATIARVYGIEPLENAAISTSPSGAKSRSDGFKVNFNYASAGLVPKRDVKRWSYLNAIDKSNRMILPLWLYITLNAHGAHCYFRLRRQMLGEESSCRVTEFFERHYDRMIKLAYMMQGVLLLYDGAAMKTRLMIEDGGLFANGFNSSKSSEVLFMSRIMRWPLISGEQCERLRDFMVLLYPIFASICDLAKSGEEHFDDLYPCAIDYTHSRYGEICKRGSRVKGNADACSMETALKRARPDRAHRRDDRLSGA